MVVHTMAYFRGILPLGLKGRFYAILVFRSKGKILRDSCLYVLNGNILRHSLCVKPNSMTVVFWIYNGKILRDGYFLLICVALAV